MGANQTSQNDKNRSNPPSQQQYNHSQRRDSSPRRRIETPIIIYERVHTPYNLNHDHQRDNNRWRQVNETEYPNLANTRGGREGAANPAYPNDSGSHTTNEGFEFIQNDSWRRSTPGVQQPWTNLNQQPRPATQNQVPQMPTQPRPMDQNQVPQMPTQPRPAIQNQVPQMPTQPRPAIQNQVPQMPTQPRPAVQNQVPQMPTQPRPAIQNQVPQMPTQPRPADQNQVPQMTTQPLPAPPNQVPPQRTVQETWTYLNQMSQLPQLATQKPLPAQVLRASKDTMTSHPQPVSQTTMTSQPQEATQHPMPPPPVRGVSPAPISRRSASRDRHYIDSKHKCSTCNKGYGAYIYQCKSGHSACQECRAAATPCALCGLPIIEMRNYMLEEYLSKLEVPCPNAIDGCRLHFKSMDIDIHLQECPFGIMDCPMKSVNGNCFWRGKSEQLFAHFDRFHPSERSGEVNTEMISRTNMDSHKIYIVQLLPHCFIFHEKVDSRNGVYMTVQLVGTAVSASKWIYEVHVYTKQESRRKFTYTGVVSGSKTPVNDIFDDSDCAVLPMKYARTFTNGDALNYKFFIKKQDNARQGNFAGRGGRPRRNQ